MYIYIYITTQQADLSCSIFILRPNIRTFIPSQNFINVLTTYKILLKTADQNYLRY